MLNFRILSHNKFIRQPLQEVPESLKNYLKQTSMQNEHIKNDVDEVSK